LRTLAFLNKYLADGTSVSGTSRPELA